MVKYHNVEQRSTEWTLLRIGKLTSSKLKSIIDVRTGKLKSPNVLRTAASKIIAEIQTEFSLDSEYMSEAMEWGIEQEQVVIDKYATKSYKPVGFVTNDKYQYLGVSPDMLFFDGKGAVSAKEIKCPNSDTHVRYMIEDKIPSDHIPQIICYFLVIDTLEELTFVSYDPRNQKKEYYLKKITRVDIEDILIEAEKSVLTFENAINKYLDKI